MELYGCSISGNVQTELVQQGRQGFGRAVALVRAPHHEPHVAVIPSTRRDKVGGLLPRYAGLFLLDTYGLRKVQHAVKPRALAAAHHLVNILIPGGKGRLTGFWQDVVLYGACAYVIHREARRLCQHR